MGVALLVAGGYIYLNRQGAKTAEGSLPATTLISAPATTVPPTTIAAATPVPPTTAPPPTFGKAVGKGASAMKAAQAAFARNDYGQAMAQAQKALAEDPADRQAKSLVENALNGQKAEARFASAESALRQGQFERAMSEAQAASGAGGHVSAGKSFVSAKTSAQSVETRSGGAVPEGFEETPGVNARKGSQAAELPGKILFDIDPQAVKPGENYTVKVYLLNEGNAPIQVREMLVNTRINGR